MGWDDMCNVNVLVNKTLTKIDKGDNELVFHTSDGEKYRMYHNQDCCESVYIEDINGDLNDLIGTPILLSSEDSSNQNPPGVDMGDYQDSFTWTFYRFGTIKGYVDIRWYGNSNGYYSERVDFEKVK